MKDTTEARDCRPILTRTQLRARVDERRSQPRVYAGRYLLAKPGLVLTAFATSRSKTPRRCIQP
jgi:hypothetical protein